MGVSDPVVHLFTQHSLTAYLIHNQYLLDVRHCAEQVRLYSALRSLYFLFPLPLPLAGSSSSSRSCLRDRILGRTAPSSHVQEALQADSALALPFWRLSLSGFRLEYKLHGGRCPDCLARCYFRGSHCARHKISNGVEQLRLCRATTELPCSGASVLQRKAQELRLRSNTAK